MHVGSGLAELDPPNELEARALARIKAGKDIRLACQLHPKSYLAITPLVMANQPLSTTLHSGGLEGHEEYVVAMFVDMHPPPTLASACWLTMSYLS